MGNGRVSSLSAREYSCLRKYVWASQNASLGSSSSRNVSSVFVLHEKRDHALVQLTILSPQNAAES